MNKMFRLYDLAIYYNLNVWKSPNIFLLCNLSLVKFVFVRWEIGFIMAYSRSTEITIITKLER